MTKTIAPGNRASVAWTASIASISRSGSPLTISVPKWIWTGEKREAIALAEEVSADLLLVDDWDARREAERRHLRAVGTLRVLADGAGRGLTDLQEDFDGLRRTNFRVNPELLESSLDEHRRGFEVQ